MRPRSPAVPTLSPSPHLDALAHDQATTAAHARAHPASPPRRRPRLPTTLPRPRPLPTPPPGPRPGPRPVPPPNVPTPPGTPRRAGLGGDLRGREDRACSVDVAWRRAVGQKERGWLTRRIKRRIGPTRMGGMGWDVRPGREGQARSARAAFFAARKWAGHGTTRLPRTMGSDGFRGVKHWPATRPEPGHVRFVRARRATIPVFVY